MKNEKRNKVANYLRLQVTCMKKSRQTKINQFGSVKIKKNNITFISTIVGIATHPLILVSLSISFYSPMDQPNPGKITCSIHPFRKDRALHLFFNHMLGHPASGRKKESKRKEKKKRERKKRKKKEAGYFRSHGRCGGDWLFAFESAGSISEY